VKGEDQEQKEDQGVTEAVKEVVKKEAETIAESTERQIASEGMDEDKMETEDQKTEKEVKATTSEGGEDKENQA
jgi:hypothetical protein